MTPYYQRDGITIYHGDCREVLPGLGPVDLVLGDPPYGLPRGFRPNPSGGFMDQRQADAISDWDKTPDLDCLLQIASLAPTIFWGGNYLGLPAFPVCLVWDKDQPGMHFAECEIAWTNFTKGSTRLLRCPLRSQEVFGTRSERQHPTQKPLAVMSWCLSLVPEARSVLDPFMGSGTTLVAAKDRGLTAIGIELEERYCEIAANRLAQGVLITA